MPVGVVIRRSPGVTRWAKTVWRVTSVLPGAMPATWKQIRQEGDVVEFHAATLDVMLYVADTEAYVHELQAETPSVYVILRESDTDEKLDVLMVTASPYEAQDYADSAEEIVEKVPMPPMMLHWVNEFVETHHVEEEFIKRRRDKHGKGDRQDGIGDARINKASDVYSVPRRAHREASE
ncbi:MAG: DUF3305 domain-containing protein [Roseobacter sp.]